MSGLFTIVIAAHLNAGSQEVPECQILTDVDGVRTTDPRAVLDWQIWSLTSSGRGGRNVIYVDATGRNVAFVDIAGRDLRDLAEDVRRGVPGSFCETQPLSEYQVRKFAFRIASIPIDVLENGGLHVTDDSCIAERTQGITLWKNGRKFHFGYSLCGNPEVPDWLSSLEDALWARYREIKACNATPLGPTSLP